MTRYMSGRALGLMVLVTLCWSINATGFTSVCGDCVYKGGAGYVKHPTICYAFYECDNTTREYTLLHCPSGMTWNDQIWSCVVDTSCAYTTSPTTTPNPCLVNSVDPSNPAGFVVTFNGQVFNMNCAPGTVYNATTCKCDIPTTASLPPCMDELYIPCAVDTNDHSGNWLWVANTDVTLATVPGRSFSACSFDGSADLSVPFFKNNDLGDNWTIKFNYRSQTGSTGNRVLVSNSVCDSISPTLEVIHSQDTVCVNIETNTNTFTLCSSNTGSPPPNLPYVPVTVKVHNGQLILVNGLHASSIPITGTVKLTKCPLAIGTGYKRVNYLGLLWNFQIWKCNPDSFTNVQQLTPATPLP
ncbi:uncharacterized protein [Haliotis asinina]